MTPIGERLIRKVRRCPSLLRLLSDTALHDLTQTLCADEALRETFVAEILHREWLFAGDRSEVAKDRRRLLNAYWEGCGRNMRSLTGVVEGWLREQAARRTFEVPPDLFHGNAERIGRLLSRLLGSWRNADGLIVFVGDTDREWIAKTVALPFLLRMGMGRDCGCALGIDNCEISKLSESVRAANRAIARMGLNGSRGSTYDVALPTISGESASLLGGASAGLPVLLSILLKSEIKESHPFALAATGVLSAYGELDDCAQTPEVIRAKVELLTRIGVERIIVSGEPKLHLGEASSIEYWNGNDSLAHRVDAVKNSIQTKQAAASRNIGRLEEACKRIDRDMHHGTVPPSEAQEQLHDVLRAVEAGEDVRSLDLRAHAELLMATACCHAGSPSEALEWLEKAKKKRTQLGSFLFGKAIIRQSVNLTDLGRYEEAAKMTDEVAEIAAGVRSSEKLLLKLEAAGTRGQALTFLGLTEPSARAPALQSLERAVALAREFDGGESTERELPRDLCYLYQWCAFFDRSRCDAVWKEFMELTAEGHSSHDFMKRLRWLAAYRALLEKEDFGWKPFEHDLPKRYDVNDRVSWLHRLSRKYRGALRISLEDTEAGIQDFEDGMWLIQESRDAPILRLIGVTVALEAYRLLKKAAPDAARKYHQLACETLYGDLARFHHADYSRFVKIPKSAGNGNLVRLLHAFPY